MDKSEERKDELRLVAINIKVYLNHSVIEYIAEHRTLRNDMINAGCAKLIRDVDEKVIIMFMLNVLKDDPDWEPFRSEYNMFKKVKDLEDIDELEDWMLDDECKRGAKQ